LIIIAVLITVGAIYDAGESATVEILGQTLTTTVAGVFIAGLVTMLLFLLGMWAMSASFGRAKRKRADRKAAKREQKESVSRLEQERAALREENERLSRELAERQRTTSAPAVSSGAVPAAGGAAVGAVAANSGGRGTDDASTHMSGHPSGETSGYTSGQPTQHEHDTSHTSGPRSLMDRVTGRHQSGSHDAHTHETTGHDATPDSTYGTSQDSTGLAGREELETQHLTPTDPATSSQASSEGTTAPADDRVIDHRTDVTSTDTTESHRH
jgi:cbb3-type cytochrome oxidase subunit 3